MIGDLQDPKIEIKGEKAKVEVGVRTEKDIVDQLLLKGDTEKQAEISDRVTNRT